MAEFNKLNDQDLENVTGGDARTVNTGSKLDAVVRAGAGTNFPQVASLKNGTIVYATGNNARAGGRTWYEVSAPVYGWIAGGILGLPDRY